MRDGRLGGDGGRSDVGRSEVPPRQPHGIGRVSERRAARRYAARIPVQIDARGRRFSGETANLSTNGVLVMLEGDLAADAEVSVRLEHPTSGRPFELDGRVANRTRCERGLIAVGIQFRYALDRCDEVAQVVDALRGRHRAHLLTHLHGSLEDTPLEDVIETFSNAAREGTLHLSRGEEVGRIAFRDGDLILSAAGLVTGAKALSRMLGWKDVRFEFEPAVAPGAALQPPLPMASAVLAAAVERDELALLDLGPLHADLTFAVDAERLAAIEPSLDSIGREVCESAGLGFPLGALLDMLADSDLCIYRSIIELLQAGVLRADAG